MELQLCKESAGKQKNPSSPCPNLHTTGPLFMARRLHCSSSELQYIRAAVSARTLSSLSRYNIYTQPSIPCNVWNLLHNQITVKLCSKSSLKAARVKRHWQ